MKKLLITIFALGLITLGIILLFCNGKVKPVAPSTNTEFQIVNTTQDSVYVYLTLSGYPAADSTKFVQDVNGIFGCTQTGLNGMFWLYANDTVSYTSVKGFSGNISFGVAPMNCPTEAWPTGMNLFEFNLNEPQESIDISCMAGVNCILICDLIGGPAWPASNLFPNPRVLKNDTMGANTDRVGVYPYGCTNCTNTQGKQSCQTPSETPNTSPICNPTRAAGERGGLVRVKFDGYTNWKICAK